MTVRSTLPRPSGSGATLPADALVHLHTQIGLLRVAGDHDPAFVDYF